MRLNITAEFAKKDDCLDRMIPSDLRLLVSERDAALRERDALREELRADDGMVRVPVELLELAEVVLRADGFNDESKAIHAMLEAASKGE